MITVSTIIEKLNPDIIANIKSELNSINPNLWGNHVFEEYWGEFAKTYNSTGALRHGKTCWLQIITQPVCLRYSILHMYPTINNIIHKVAGNESVLRVFWHTLRPGDCINRHTDDAGPYFAAVTHRYQIYLDIPESSFVFIDNEIKNPKDFENCILDFNAAAPHEYKNNSDKDLTFLVFDTSSIFSPVSCR